MDRRAMDPAEWEEMLVELVKSKNKEYEFITVFSYVENDNKRYHYDQIPEDTSLALYAFSMIFVYNILFLGSFSPIHCRITLAALGIVCIGLSIACGYGLAIRQEIP